MMVPGLISIIVIIVARAERVTVIVNRSGDRTYVLTAATRKVSGSARRFVEYEQDPKVTPDG
jgi:hypothetical protein